MLGSITFWFTDQSTPKFLPTVRGIVVDNLLFRFSICGSVLDILAIKVESCKKSRRILDDFCPPKIFWGGPFKPESLRYISVTGHWSIFIRILMMGSERQAHNVTEWIITLRGHPRSSILALIESACAFLLVVNSNLDPVLQRSRQGSMIRSVRILLSERYVRTLTYSILAYVNKNRIRKQTTITEAANWFFATVLINLLFPVRLCSTKRSI